MNDPKFMNGLIFKLPRDNAPDFVKGSLSIRREELITVLADMTDEWINLDLKVSKAGKAYAQINEFKPQSRQDEAIAKSQPPQQTPVDNDFDDDIPF
ncbi:MAG: hypothetical protein V3T88_02750 [Nitrosomonadaceae bacterium]